MAEARSGDEIRFPDPAVTFTQGEPAEKPAVAGNPIIITCPLPE